MPRFFNDEGWCPRFYQLTLHYIGAWPTIYPLQLFFSGGGVGGCEGPLFFSIEECRKEQWENWMPVQNSRCEGAGAKNSSIFLLLALPPCFTLTFPSLADSLAFFALKNIEAVDSLRMQVKAEHLFLFVGRFFLVLAVQVQQWDCLQVTLLHSHREIKATYNYFAKTLLKFFFMNIAKPL